MVQWISSGVPIPIKSPILVKDVSPQFDGIVVARTCEVLAGEKSWPIFPNGGMIGDSSHSSSI